jgi:hypothetical protein
MRVIPNCQNTPGPVNRKPGQDEDDYLFVIAELIISPGFGASTRDLSIHLEYDILEYTLRSFGSYGLTKISRLTPRLKALRCADRKLRRHSQ